MPVIGWDMEELEHLYTTDESINQKNHFGKQYGSI